VAEPADPQPGPAGQELPETVWLYSLDEEGVLLEHRRHSAQWTQRSLTKELGLPSIQACACAFDEAAGARVLYFVDTKGALHELPFRPGPAASTRDPPRPHRILESCAPDLRVHAESQVVCVAVPGGAGRAPARGLVVIDSEGRLRLATKRAGAAGQREDAPWECDTLQPGPAPSLEPGARIAAGGVGARLSIFYCSGESPSQLCQATWQGPGQWTSGRVECRDLSWPVRPQSLAAIFDGKIGRAYVSSDSDSDSGSLWEIEVPASPGGGQGKAWCMTRNHYRERALPKVAAGPVVAGQIPRSRAEGGGLAGREVVVVRGHGPDAGKYLHRFFVGGRGCGALEGRGVNEWQLQYLNMDDEGSRSRALACDVAAGPAVCALATAGGTHHIFYAAEGGDIVEL
jgi:hypothetical protein